MEPIPREIVLIYVIGYAISVILCARFKVSFDEHDEDKTSRGCASLLLSIIWPFVLFGILAFSACWAIGHIGGQKHQPDNPEPEDPQRLAYTNVIRECPYCGCEPRERPCPGCGAR